MANVGSGLDLGSSHLETDLVTGLVVLKVYLIKKQLQPHPEQGNCPKLVPLIS